VNDKETEKSALCSKVGARGRKRIKAINSEIGGRVRGTGTMITATKTLFLDREEKIPLWRLGVDERITRVLQNVIRKWDMRMKIGFISPRIGPLRTWQGTIRFLDTG
jgi:hypothetical protein